MVCEGDERVGEFHSSSSFLMAFCGNEVKVEIFSLMEVPATDLAAQ